jgi:hypothetical protein
VFIPATASAASVALVGRAEEARSSRQIFQHTHSKRPAREQKADDLQNLRRQRGEQNAQRCRGDNPDQNCLAPLGTWQAGRSKADDDDVVSRQHEVDQNDFK